MIFQVILVENCVKSKKMDIWGLSEHIIKDIGGLKSKRKEKTFIILMASLTSFYQLTCMQRKKKRIIYVRNSNNTYIHFIQRLYFSIFVIGFVRVVPKKGCVYMILTKTYIFGNS